MVKNDLAVKKLSAFFSKITSKYNRDFLCLICLHSSSAENKLKKPKNISEDYDYYYIDMLKEESILKYNNVEKSKKSPFIIYADIECLLNKIYTCHNNSKRSSTIKKK